MVIAGKIRSNAPQLASYLLATGKNEHITIMDVDGRHNANATHLKEMLYSMELNSELTRSRNSIYHAYINPNPDDTTDRAMTMEEWQHSVDILTKQLGFEDQRRVVVLHEKPGNRVHAHIVYERYNQERGVMATYEDNYKAHDRARSEMEKKLNHKPTPQKNKNRAHHKQTLTEIWQRTNTSQAFMREAQANGYKIAKGTDRPYKVVDADGVSFDLVRKLDGVKTSDVRQRFGNTDLMPEKQAIKEMQSAKQEPQKHKSDPVTNSEGFKEAKTATVDSPAIEKKTSEPADDNGGNPVTTPAPTIAQAEARQQFLQNVKDVRERNRSLTREITLSVLIALRVCFSFKGNEAEQRAALKQQFVTSTHEITAKQQKPPKQTLGFVEAAQFYKPT